MLPPHRFGAQHGDPLAGGQLGKARDVVVVAVGVDPIADAQPLGGPDDGGGDGGRQRGGNGNETGGGTMAPAR